jgi:hypothetical protein
MNLGVGVSFLAGVLAFALSCGAGAKDTNTSTAPTKETVGGTASQISQTLKDIKDPQQRLAAAQAVAALALQDAGVTAGDEHGAKRSDKAAFGMAMSEVAHALNEIKDPAKRGAAAQALLALAQKNATEESSKHAEDADHDDHVNHSEKAERTADTTPDHPEKPSRPDLPERPAKPDLPEHPH